MGRTSVLGLMPAWTPYFVLNRNSEFDIVTDMTNVMDIPS